MLSSICAVAVAAERETYVKLPRTLTSVPPEGTHKHTHDFVSRNIRQTLLRSKHPAVQHQAVLHYLPVVRNSSYINDPLRLTLPGCLGS